MKTKVQLGYVLGTSSLLAAAAYFYASNWGVLSRWEKLVPVFVLIAALYGVSAWLSGKPGRLFLSRLALLSSCLLFGVGVALVGQIYNSHADSYGLFAVWLVPALLFAARTRWQPFDVLAWLLAQFAYLLYFFPSDGSFDYTEPERIWIMLGLIALNGVLYALTTLQRPASPSVRLLAFVWVHALLLVLSISFLNENYGWIFNFPLVALLAADIWYFHKTRSKLYLLLSGLGVSIFTVVKYVELLIHYYNEAFIVLSLVFVVLFIGGNVKFLKYILKFADPGDAVADGPEHAGETPEAASERDARKLRSGYFQWAARVLTAAAIAVGTVLGTVSLVGLLVVVLGIDNPQNILVFFGIVVLAAMIAARHLNPVIRYTLITVSLIVGSESALFLDHAGYSLSTQLVFLALAVAGFVVNPGLLQRCYFSIAGELLLWQALRELLPGWDSTARLVAAAVIFGLICLLSAVPRLPEAVKKPLLICVYPGWLLAFFALTFETQGAWYYVTGIAFFVVATAALFLGKHYRQQAIYTSSLVLWIAFLFYKYYETAWKLLHKSFSLALLGVLLLLATAWLERRAAAAGAAAIDEPVAPARRMMWTAALLIVLELAFLAAQVARSEWQLSHGQRIKLQLAPLDPRSLLQGDYVQLRYEITEPPLSDRVRAELDQQPRAALVLAPDNAGVYRFQRMYRSGEQLAAGEVRMNARWSSYAGFRYGIETYFVPEGTGGDVQRDARFAEVNVSAAGDAMVVRLLTE